MKFKFDENFSVQVRQPFLDLGHEVETVYSEGLQGQPDERIYEVCCNEQRCLITWDLDFANVVRYPPAPTGGIIVVRGPNNSLKLLQVLLRQALQLLNQRPVAGQLWVVEPGRVRFYLGGAGERSTNGPA